MFCFGLTQDPRFEAFGRLLFDWYRCPALEVTISPGKRWKIDRLRARPLGKLGPEDAAFFRAALHHHSAARLAQSARPHRRQIFARRALRSAGETAAVLRRDDPLFPEIRRAAFRRGRTVDQAQLAELAEFDGLFIRATTSIDNYTYRFARRALQEGMPVIDDPVSMIRCTNKVYLHELMEAHGVPIPPTVMLAEDEDLVQGGAGSAGRWW